MHYILIGILIYAVYRQLKKRSEKKFDRQLSVFYALGFRLNEGITEKDLLIWEKGKKSYEAEPYSLLYQTLGLFIQREPWTPLTNQCWNFDTESIEDHGSYVEIFKNMERLTNGQLTLEALEDYVDLEEEVAWVQFTVKGFRYRWDLNVNDDWVDTRIFNGWVELVKQHCPEFGFTYFDTGGQNVILGFESKKSFKQIRSKTGLAIEWLE